METLPTHSNSSVIAYTYVLDTVQDWNLTGKTFTLLIHILSSLDELISLVHNLAP